MLAGIDKPTVTAIAERAPSLDFLSFQIYGEIDRLPEILNSAGYDGPYQITEWGPTGHWESPETSWQRPFEPSSTQKASDISRRYQEVILADSKRCLGAYLFLWGQKQERTPTWYGVFLASGERLVAIASAFGLYWTACMDKSTIEPFAHLHSLSRIDYRRRGFIHGTSSTAPSVALDIEKYHCGCNF